MPTISEEIQKLAPSALVELFVLDAAAQGGGVSRFHAGTKGLSQPVVWQAETFTPYPIEAAGFEASGKGALPRPTLRVANIGGAIGAMCAATDDLVGARLTRQRTFQRFLDAVNFAGGINAEADPNAHLADDIYFVNRKASENAVFVEFELASALDVHGVNLPRRVVIQNTCMWRYRGAECGYTGGAVADKNDAATADPAADQCGKRLASCKLRFGAYGELPYGGFPGAGLQRG
jgi:lambda family phage minor tail protein L